MNRRVAGSLRPVAGSSFAVLLATMLPAQTAWQKLSTATKPGNCISCGMVYDSARDRVVLFNGATWEFDGKDWRRIAANTPGFVRNFGMAYDAARKRTVLFAGLRGSVSNQTWEWDGAKWTQRTPRTIPPPRCCAPMGYDSKRRRVVLFGGYDYKKFLSDTWEWDGTNWTEFKPPAAFTPPARCCTDMAYDSARSVMVMFGGGVGVSSPDVNDTWLWLGGIWLNVKPKTNPSARRAASMMFDAARSRIVMFGGGVGGGGNPKLGDTWEWDGKDWSLIQPGTAPSARYQHSMVYDARRGRALMYGGVPLVGQTWDYGGSLLTGDVHAVSLARGGLQTLTLRAGTAHGGRFFAILGTASGTYPGLSQGPINLPLNPDIYFSILLNNPNTLISPSIGSLDNSGNATSQFKLPSNLPAALKGLQLHHAYAVLNGTAPQLTSNAVPVRLIQ